MADDTKLVHRPRLIDIVKKGASDFSQKKNYLPVNQILPTARGSDGRVKDVSGSWWSPLQPITPSAPADQRPRQRAVVPGENIVWTPGADKLLGYETLRALADTWDVLRLIIETRKDQLCSLDWEIRVKEKPGEMNSDRKQRQLEDPNVKKIKDFLDKPDGFNPWQRWLRMWLEDSLVLDAVSLWYERDKSGKIANVIPLDAATIARCMTDQGLTPPAPSIAYQQVLYGVPAFDLTTDDLLYSMRNPRTSRRYGYSRIEQMMATIGTGIRSQDFLLKYYTDGNMPEAMVFLPSDLGIDRVKEVQNWFDAVMAGDLARRRRLTFLPGYGSGDNVKPNVVFPKEALLKAPTDEWIVLIACFCFGVSPQPFIKMMNRATAEVARESAEAEGLKPDADYVKEVINQIIDDLGFSEDYEFAWQDRRDVDPKTAAETDNILVGKVYTVNEIREKRGDDPFDAPEADMLGMFGATGFIPLNADDALDRQNLLNPAAPEDGETSTPNPKSGKQPDKKKPSKKPIDAASTKKVHALPTGAVGFITGVETVDTANMVGRIAFFEKGHKVIRFQHGDQTLASQRAEIRITKGLKKVFRAQQKLVHAALSEHLEKLAKYSEDEPRDERGRWTSDGTAPPDTGFYHGTSAHVVDEILTNGIRVAPGSELFGSKDKVIALVYARQRASRSGNDEGAVVHFKKDPFERNSVIYGRHAGSTTQDVPLSNISHIEIFSGADLRGKKDAEIVNVKPIRVLIPKAEKLAKSKEDELLDELLRNIETEFDDVPDWIAADLEASILSGVEQGFLQLGIKDEDLLASVNELARDWAVDRAAELVGRKRNEDGELVDNPNAAMAISDTTRDEIQRIVSHSFEETNVTLDDVANRIQASGIFSESRAEMIARTEVNRAQTEGNYKMWQESGQVGAVEWLKSNDEGVCEDCESNDGVVVSIGQSFPSGAEKPGDDHPNCRCILVAAQIGEA